MSAIASYIAGVLSGGLGLKLLDWGYNYFRDRNKERKEALQSAAIQEIAASRLYIERFDRFPNRYVEIEKDSTCYKRTLGARLQRLLDCGIRDFNDADIDVLLRQVFDRCGFRFCRLDEIKTIGYSRFFSAVAANPDPNEYERGAYDILIDKLKQDEPHG